MRQLTLKEEYDILWALNGEDPIGNGSSRIVFDCPDDLAAQLNLDNNYHYVIKVAYCYPGRIQKEREDNFFRTWEKDKNAKYLAAIAATGRYISIMECVEPIDYLFEPASGEEMPFFTQDDINKLIDWHKNNSEYNKQQLNKIYHAAVSVYCFLCSQVKHVDGVQLGLTEDKRIVCYDYAFNDDDCPQFTSDYCRELWGGENVNYFIETLRMLIEEVLKKGEALFEVPEFLDDADKFIEDTLECFYQSDYKKEKDKIDLDRHKKLMEVINNSLVVIITKEA